MKPFTFGGVVCIIGYMSAFDTQELEFSERIALAIRVGESHYREFKSALQGPPGAKLPRPIKEILIDIGRTLVAFANADGGELIVGIEDDGAVTGIPHSEKEFEQMVEAWRTHVYHETPLPTPRVRRQTYQGLEVLYYSIQKGTEYVYLTQDGRCVRRRDRDSEPVSSEAIVSDRLEDQSRKYDRTIAEHATINDLDIDLIQEVAAQIAYGISPEKCLQYLDLAEYTPAGLILKQAALLLFAKDIRRWHAGCQVRITVFRGIDRRSGEAFNVQRDEVLNENILRLLDRSWEQLTLALTSSTQLSTDAKFEQSFLYPQIACREALVNAIVHRNYAIEGRGIEVSIFQDRMELLSPGNILSTISIEDVKQLNGAHESRNPLIARVLRETGFIREMGEGMRRIFDVMRSNALAEPELGSGRNNFLVTLYNKSIYDPSIKLWLSNFDEHLLSENQRAVMALGYAGKEFSTQDVIDRLGIVNVDEVRQILTPLRAKGLIEKFKTDGAAMIEVRSRRIPKRSVKRFRVKVGPSELTVKLNGRRGVSSEEHSASALSTAEDRAPKNDVTASLIVPEVQKKSAKISVSSEGKKRTDQMAHSPLSVKKPSVQVHRLFLQNLAEDVSVQDVVDVFSRYGTVEHVDLPRSREDSSKSRGYGFLEMTSDDDLSWILHCTDGLRLNGRLLNVRKNFDSNRYAKKKTRMARV